MQRVIESAVYGMTACASVAPEGEVADLKVVGGHTPDDPLDGFVAGFLWRCPLSHELDDQKGAHSAHDRFPQPRGGGTAHGAIYI